jgi:hypothetical protein
MTLLVKPKEVKTGWQIWQNLLRKAMTQKGLFSKDDYGKI